MRILEMSLSLERGRFEARMKHKTVLFHRVYFLSLFLRENFNRPYFSTSFFHRSNKLSLLFHFQF